jgi:uncharacterized membrane protein YgcG
MEASGRYQAITDRISKGILIEEHRSRQLQRDLRIIRAPLFFVAFGRTARTAVKIWSMPALLAVVVAAVLLTAGPKKAFSAQLPQDAQDVPQATESVPLTPEALQRLVAPIALYPDALVAQILAASTYPSEIVEADRWLQDHSNLKDENLADEVDKQSWDPSVKALTAFSSVLANLDANLSWTSALGDAYFNQQQDVLDAVQTLRTRAEGAGNLQSTPQETVASQGTTITIEPADPNVCYVPTYNPLLVYGAPIGIYPGYLYDSLVGAPYISFGIGIGIGGRFWGGFGWGFHSWGCNWRGHSVTFNNNIYVSHSPTFFHRFPGGGVGNFRGGAGRPSLPGNSGLENGRNRGGAFLGRDPTLPPGIRRSDPTLPPGVRYRDPTLPPGAFPNGRDFRGFGQPGSNTGTRSGAFSGIGPGGIERGSADRGRASLGGEGGFGGGRGFGGGGGMRGGGGGRGGGRH